MSHERHRATPSRLGFQEPKSNRAKIESPAGATSAHEKDLTPRVEIHKELTPISLTKMGIWARVRGVWEFERKRASFLDPRLKEMKSESERERRRLQHPKYTKPAQLTIGAKWIWVQPEYPGQVVKVSGQEMMRIGKEYMMPENTQVGWKINLGIGSLSWNWELIKENICGVSRKYIIDQLST